MSTGLLVEARDYLKGEVDRVKGVLERKEVKFKSETELLNKRVSYLEREVMKKEQVCLQINEKLFKEQGLTV
jgi:hypothetical protein